MVHNTIVLSRVAINAEAIAAITLVIAIGDQPTCIVKKRLRLTWWAGWIATIYCFASLSDAINLSKFSLGGTVGRPFLDAAIGDD